MKLTYIRWSMTIIETMGHVIVTDPVFKILGIRQTPKHYTFARMPQPDLVFISHTHIDHFEPSTLRRLPPRAQVWMASGKLDRALGLGINGLRGVQEWESDQIGGIRLTVVPALHKGGEVGLVVQGDRTVYFAGDTSLDRDLFRAIGQRWSLDAVLLPIGDLRSLGIPFGHTGPARAAHALRLLGEPRVVIPTHYSGMTLGPFMHFAGTPRKLSAALHKAEVGALIGTTRPLESIEM